ncbi:MarR family transcriptional regulator [Brevibacillus brevis]|uniref:MarR family transcriptional regulator n=1 Tax=Brevibacillus brevis TaxID=1393 RepID=A0ABY9T792_BREBE|nr:MarR family transcriptional regulator [Brevibacillus brevis]WNC15970.1 MarR family transcriptional regulator [Brevibacillus brevis]
MSIENHQKTENEWTPLQRDLLLEVRKNSSRAVMFHQAISDRLGLNATDHKCLDYLLSSGPVTAGRLAELTGLTTGAVTNVIDRLEKAGYIVRDKDPNDRRRVVVKPVPEKVSAISPLFQSILEKTIRIIDSYTEQEQTAILDFLRRCNDMTLEEMNRWK